jgi:hypothetical protein
MISCFLIEPGIIPRNHPDFQNNIINEKNINEENTNNEIKIKIENKNENKRIRVIEEGNNNQNEDNDNNIENDNDDDKEETKLNPILAKISELPLIPKNREIEKKNSDEMEIDDEKKEINTLLHKNSNIYSQDNFLKNLKFLIEKMD